MTIFRHILGLGAAASVLVSCLSSVKPDGRREAITFEPVVGTEVRSGETSEFPEDVSLGIWTVTSEGQTFIDREEVTFDGETWSTASPYYWPEDATLHFFCFAPYEYGMQMNAGGLVLENYHAAAGGEDLLVSEAVLDHNKTDATVRLTFRPATSKIDFRVIDGLNDVTSVKLEKIVLCGVYEYGDFDSSADPQWTPSGEKTDIVFYDSSLTGISDDVWRDPEFFGNSYSVIPQQSRPRVKVVYSFQTADSEWLFGQENWTEELEAEWEPGRHYTYTLTLTETIVKHSTGIGTTAEQ